MRSFDGFILLHSIREELKDKPKRMLTIFELQLENYSDKQIADELKLKLQTVQKYIREIRVIIKVIRSE